MREKVKIISVLLSAVLLVSLLYLITYGGAVYAGEEESSEKEEKEKLIDLEELEQKRTAIKGKYFRKCRLIREKNVERIRCRWRQEESSSTVAILPIILK